MKVLYFLAIVFSFSFFSCSEEKINTNAEVLSINENILEGRLIGSFLSSSSGYISDDVIKISVKFEAFGQLFLEDLKVQRAELIYFKDTSSMPLVVIRDDYVNSNGYRIYLLNREIKTVYKYKE